MFSRTRFGKRADGSRACENTVHGNTRPRETHCYRNVRSLRLFKNVFRREMELDSDFSNAEKPVAKDEIIAAQWVYKNDHLI